MSHSRKKILFQISGSIAAYKSCALISKLVQANYEVKVVCSKSALEFVGKATLEGLSGNPVSQDLFEPGKMMDHIHLNRWADLVLLCPASASRLNRLAVGTAEDLIGALFLAHDFQKPYWIIPAMNQAMWAHPTTQSSIQKLTQMGIRMFSSEVGHQACGEFGHGRMSEPEAIFIEIETYFNPKKTNPLQILITSGATREHIDPIRYLSNGSTGRTGAELATFLLNQGHTVHLLHSASAETPTPHSHLRESSFRSFDDLNQTLMTVLSSQRFDLVIHLAAVSDYSVKSIRTNNSKIQKAPLTKKLETKSTLELTLEKNPKLIEKIKSYSKKQNPNLKVIGFKLTNRSFEKNEILNAVQKISESSDWVVHNHWEDTSSGKPLFRIYKKTTELGHYSSPKDLGRGILEIIQCS